MTQACISLLTDFGLYDEYVGVMKGVIASINPHATVIDISHHIAPQNIIQGAFMLNSAYAFFPESTVHLAVVDPGVGTDRRIIGLRANNHFFLAPDNGILTCILDNYSCEAVTLSRSELYLPEVSCTFHGRDIFAPVAAHLSNSRDIHLLGQTISPTHLIKLPDTKPVITKTQISGKVIMIDRFGNLITNISKNDLSQLPEPSSIVIHVDDCQIFDIKNHYAQVPQNSLIAIIGSKGLLEICVNCGNAKKILNIKIGCRVQVTQTKT